MHVILDLKFHYSLKKKNGGKKVTDGFLNSQPPYRQKYLKIEQHAP